MKQDFLYLFELMDFDANGQVCGSKEVDVNHARSNFLYLVSKYNQNLLKQSNLEIPVFFKENLAKLLEDVEMGGDFAQAKEEVFAHSLPKVQLLKNKTEKEAIEALNKFAVVSDENFSQEMGKAVNTLQLQYIITKITGKLFYGILNLKKAEPTAKNKSSLFKSLINYNSLIGVANNMTSQKAVAVEASRVG